MFCNRVQMAMSAEKRDNTVQSLRNGLSVLTVLADADQGLGITDLSRQLKLAKGSISRLVATLVEQGFVVRHPLTAKYRLSTKLWELGIKAVAGLDLRDVARPVLERLHEATQETVHITILTEEGQMVFLDKIDSTKAIRPNVQLGAPHPSYCTANGKAILAFLPEARRDRLLGGELHQYTSTTIASAEELLPHFLSIRRRGFAVNNGEYREDVSGVAAPIFDRSACVIAALGISMLTSRRSADIVSEFARLVIEGAREISAAFGHRGEAQDTSTSFNSSRRGLGPSETPAPQTASKEKDRRTAPIPPDKPRAGSSNHR
jgi:DNA-binding IclR family transcriptional regulator